MQIKQDGIFRDTFVLSTGREIYANCNIVGIDENLHISGGYDNGIHDVDEWSSAEKVEFAEYMIARWQAFKAQTSMAVKS